MERHSFRRQSVFQILFRAIANVSEMARKAGPVAVLCLALLTLGVVYLAAHALTRARVRTSGGGTEGSSSWWPAQSVHAQGGGPTFTEFEDPAAGMAMLQGTTGFGINAAGDITGIYITAPNPSTPNLAHGFIRSATTGAFTPIDAPGAGTAKNEGTFAFGIDTAGDVAGMYSDSIDAYHGFVRAANGTFTPFDVTGAPTAIRHRGTVPLSSNAGGDVTGFYVDAGAVRHGFVRVAASGMITTFDAPGAGTASTEGTVPIHIGTAGDITGFYKDAGGTFHGFIRKASTGVITPGIDAPGASSGPSGKVSFIGTLPTGIDATGDIAGVYSGTDGLYHGFLRAANGTFSPPIDAPNAAKGGLFPGTFPFSMNDSGVIAGFYEDSSGLNHGFVRAADGTITAPLNAPGASTGNIGMFPGGTVNVSINSSGVVTGGYFDVSGVAHGFSLTLPQAPPQAATPTFSPPANTYATAQSVTISDSTPGAVIHFAINATPDASSPTFTTPIQVSSNETLEAIAIATGFSNSAVGTAAYVINQPTPDFLVAVNPTTLTIVAGKSGMATFTVTPENGFNSQVSFACTGLPSEASCSFNPPNVTPNGGPASSTLTVSTMAPSGAVPVSQPSIQLPIYALLFPILAMILAMMLGIASRRIRELRAWQPLALLIFLIAAAALASCNGGGGGNPGTPAGTTTASVSAATGGGALKHGANLKITITK
jgi:hypothetical protein